VSVEDDLDPVRAPTTAAGPPLPDAPTASDRYRRGAEIARGGMGRVVEAEDAVLGRTVALKETLELDDDARRRFEREVRITARLEHPSIVPVYDAGRAPGGLPFYVMRRLTGRPLDQIIRAAPTLDERLTYVPNVLAVLDAVGHAHRRGIIHRDLKPANVLVGELGETVVIDWGLAKVLGEGDVTGGGPLPALADALADAVPPRTPSARQTGDPPRTGDPGGTAVGIVVGTPGFMPPEQAVGEDVDARSDVYALGATLYHLLAGAPPYAGTSASAILDRTVAEPPPRIAVAGCPPDLVTIVDKAMAPTPADRYRDAAAMGEDVRRFLSGQLVAAHHYSRRERLVRYVRRNRALLAVVALAIVALAVVATLSLRRIIADRDRIATARAAAEAGRTEAERKSAELRRLADGLILDQARSNLATDPTLALAIIKRLPADSSRWPEARAIIAEARNRGVAFALAGHAGGVYKLELSADGEHALSGGARDGILRTHDLVARTTATIDRAYTVADHLVMWWGKQVLRLTIPTHRLELLSPADGSVTRALATSAVWARVSGADQLVWCEEDGAIRILPPGATTPELVATQPGARWLDVSPGGSRIVVQGAQQNGRDVDHLYTRGPDGWRLVTTIPNDLGVRFSVDDRRYAYALGEELVEIDTSTTPPETTRYPLLPMTMTYGYAGTRLWLARTTVGGIEVAHPTIGPRRDKILAFMTGMNGTPEPLGQDLLAIAGSSRGGQVAITQRDGAPFTLHTSDPVTKVGARPGSRFVVGAAGNHLLVWDLADFLPGTIDLDTSTADLFTVGKRHLIASNQAAWFAIDTTADGLTQQHQFAQNRGYFILYRDGILITYQGDGKIAMTEIATWTTRTIASDAPVAMPLDRDEVVVVEANGDTHTVRYDGAAGRPLGNLGAPPLAGGRRSTWVYFDGGARLLRTDGTNVETITAPAPITGSDILEDGTIYVVADHVLYRWDVGATTVVEVQRPTMELLGVVAISATDIVGMGSDRSMWRLDPITGTLGQILPALDTLPQLSYDRRCAVAVRNGNPVVADLVGKTWWTVRLGDALNAVPNADCTEVYATSMRNLILAVDIDVPYGAGVRDYAERRTNANASESHGVIEWVLPPT
jgi:hypothetical protein